MIAPTAIIRGVGITFNIPIIDVAGTTGYYDSDLNAKALKAAQLLSSNEYDFGFVHVKGTDDAGHDKSHQIKVEQFEKCDVMIENFINAVKDDEQNQYIVIVTGDHTTPTQVGDHTYEPVPIMISLLSNYHGQNAENDPKS
jgi:2,3-diphosphopglycerate-independent phosphoglycerate mutase